MNDDLDVKFMTLTPEEEWHLDLYGLLLGEQLRQGVSEVELAERMEMSQWTVRAYAHHGLKPQMNYMLKMAKALGVRISPTIIGTEGPYIFERGLTENGTLTTYSTLRFDDEQPTEYDDCHGCPNADGTCMPNNETCRIQRGEDAL
jgi:hypothetical protein